MTDPRPAPTEEVLRGLHGAGPPHLREAGGYLHQETPERCGCHMTAHALDNRPPALLLCSTVEAPPRATSLCHGCSHLQGSNGDGTARCSAFDRIPAAIWTGRADHRSPVTGDRGVTFAALGEYGTSVATAFDAQRATFAQGGTVSRGTTVLLPPGTVISAAIAAETETIEAAPENRPELRPRVNEQMPDAPPETFHTVIVVEGAPTGDRRLFERGAGTTAPLPLPFEYQEADLPAHEGAVQVGWVTRTEWQGDELHGWGNHDVDLPGAAAFDRLLTSGGRMGVSQVADDADVEIDWPEPEEDEDDLVMLFGEPDLVRFTRYRVRKVTALSLPAFTECYVEPLTPPEADDEAAMVAAAIPTAPPVAWFTPPTLDGPTAFTVDDDGRLYGHLAVWGTCHTSFQGTCVTPPESASGYAYFATGEVACADGSRVPVGQITLGTGHAGLDLNGPAAASHYDHTGTAVADVTVGQDVHGIWLAGALRPHVDAGQVRALRAAALSGDWRRIGGSLELVAALAVNVPGFPVPRTAARVASGGQLALVASGVVPAGRRVRVAARAAWVDEAAERVARTVGRDRGSRVAALAGRVHR